MSAYPSPSLSLPHTTPLPANGATHCNVIEVTKVKNKIYQIQCTTFTPQKASAYISHIALTQNVNEIYALLPVRISH